MLWYSAFSFLLFSLYILFLPENSRECDFLGFRHIFHLNKWQNLYSLSYRTPNTFPVLCWVFLVDLSHTNPIFTLSKIIVFLQKRVFPRELVWFYIFLLMTQIQSLKTIFDVSFSFTIISIQSILLILSVKSFFPGIPAIRFSPIQSLHCTITRMSFLKCHFHPGDPFLKSF